MSKFRIVCTVLVLCHIWGVCRASGEMSSLPDSLVTDDNVYRYMFSDPEKAEAVMAALRERRKLPDWELDYTEGDLCYNTGKHYRALKFYTRVLECDRAKRDDALQMDMLHRMISCYDMMHNEARKAEYMGRLLRKAEACGDEAMQAVALFNIGKSQYNQGCVEEGYCHMEQAARMMAGTEYKNRYDNLRYHYNTLLTYYEKDRRGEDALRTLDALERVVTAASGEERTGIEGLAEKERKAFYGHRVVVLDMLGRTEEADECYRRFCMLGRPTDRDQYIVMPYLFDRGMYDEILRISHLHEQFLISRGDTVNYHMTTVRKNLGRAYFETGNYKAAARNFEMLAVLRDSIKNSEQRSAVLELAEVYESGEKDKRIQLVQEQKHLLFLFLILIAGALGVVVYFNRKIRRRNIALVRAVRESLYCQEELLRKEEECRELRECTALRAEASPYADEMSGKERNTPPRTPDADAGKNIREKEQIEQIIYEINSRQLYLQSGLTQKDVLQFAQVPAYLFGTVFRKQTGEFFSEFINRKRMEYAVRLLTEHPEYTIESIAGMCGIKSKQHFHRQFLEYSGLTPSSFRSVHEKSVNK